jgi:hypothetical protein
MHLQLPESSSIRKRAFVAAIAAWTLSTAWFAALLHSPLSHWHAGDVFLAAALGALGSAGVLVEVRRSLVPGAAWTDQAQLRWVLFWAAMLFVVQYSGILIAVQSHAG